jgi:hypothetical protein
MLDNNNDIIAQLAALPQRDFSTPGMPRLMPKVQKVVERVKDPSNPNKYLLK